jgi:hypothetical protein
MLTSRVYLQRVALLDVPSQGLLGKWILQVFLHCTAHRSSAVGWIVSFIDKKLDCAPIQLDLDTLAAYPVDDFCTSRSTILTRCARVGGRRSCHPTGSRIPAGQTFAQELRLPDQVWRSRHYAGRVYASVSRHAQSVEVRNSKESGRKSNPSVPYK